MSGVSAAPALSRAELHALGVPRSTTWHATKPINPSTLYSGPVPAPATPNSPGTAGSGSASAASVNAASVQPTTPAPPGFRQQIIAVYATATKVADSISSGSSESGFIVPAMPSANEFSQALATLTQDQISEVYDAFLKAPGGFAAFAGELAQMQSALPQAPAGAGNSLIRPNLAANASGTGNTFTAATTETTDAAGNAANCPASAPGGNDGDDGIYAATLAVDIATVAAAVVPQSLVLGAYVLGEGATFTIPDPVNIVVQVLIGIGQIARDTLIWLHQINGDCTNAAQEEQVNIIFDNVNSLITLVDSRTTGIDNEEQLLYALVDSRNTLILDKIAAIQASLNLELKITIENDLLQGTGGAVADLEVPASDGGYLNATPIGVQQLVTAAMGAEQTAGQAVNPAAPEDLAAANAALAAQHYKSAFNLYGQTYREIVGN